MLPLDKIRQHIINDWRIPLYSGMLKIKNKEGKLIKFKPNQSQIKIINKIWELEKENKPVRLVVPKARQHGVTTLITAMLYVKTAFNEDKNTLIMAQLKENASEIFDKAMIMQEEIIPLLKPITYKSNAKELRFKNRGNIQIKSAESKKGGRGYTYQNILFSEIAFYSNTEELMTGTLQTVADIPGTMIIFESTGNGIGGYFYDLCKQAEMKQNQYELIFLPWFDNVDYKMEIPENLLSNEEGSLAKIAKNAKTKINLLSEGRYGDEKDYQERFNLSDEQLYWRRFQIDNKFKGNLMMFMQEYPADLDECFIASGLPVFDIVKLNELEKLCVNAKKVGFIDDHKFTESLVGWLKIYREFESGYTNRYIVVCDTGGHWEGADYSVAIVFDRLKKEVAGIAHGHFDDYEFADIAVDLCKQYGKAKLVIEINKWASETEDTTSLLDSILRKIKYPNLYKRKFYDRMSNQWSEKPGFHTNTATKKLIVDRIKKSINENENIKINDAEIIKEMKTYVIAKSKTGRTQYQAQEGCKDDRVMTYGICLVIDEELPKPKEEVKYTGSYDARESMNIF